MIGRNKTDDSLDAVVDGLSWEAIYQINCAVCPVEREGGCVEWQFYRSQSRILRYVP